MTVKIGVVMDPISAINYKKDSTMAMLWAAQDKNWQLYYMEQADLYLEQGKAMATMSQLKVFKDPEHWYELAETEQHPLADLNIILMRKDPPFDNEFIYSSYILEAAEREGSLIVNKPQSLRDCNEKVFATQFPQCCPPVLVTRDSDRLKAFHQQYQDAIFKPLDGMGGSSIFRLKPEDPNVSVIIETLTKNGTETIMAQKYLPEIIDGDKRILMIDGEPLPYCLARVPLAGETRGNLAAGGTGVPQPLTERDLWIANEIGPSLKARGLIFVGLDVIGNYLTEINVTSPTCIREIDNKYNLGIGALLMDCLEKKLA